MIIRYFLGAEAFVVIGFLLGNTVFPKRYSLVFYKFFGIIIYSLLLWYFSLLTGDSWIPMSTWAIAGLIVLGIAVSALKGVIPTLDKKQLKDFIALEMVSTLIFFFLVYIRTFKPDILGTEKLMDVALVNAIQKQGVLPIENPWLSGLYMNYYYFGHFILGVLQHLFKVPSAVGYNLAISLFGVWILQALFVVARSIRLKPMNAAIAAFLVTFGGNLYLLFESILRPDQNQWFASATRVIPYTINEFPSYSIVLGDLHGHYLSYPFFLIGVFLLIDIFFPEGRKKGKESVETKYKSAFLGLLLGALYLINSWDVLTLAFVGSIFAFMIMIQKGKISHTKLSEWFTFLVMKIGVPIAIFAIPQYFLSKLFYFPPVSGIGFNTQYSSLWDIFRLFGQFIVPFIIGILVLIFTKTKLELNKKEENIEMIIPLLMFTIGIILIIIVEFFYAKDVFSFLNPPYARTNTVFKIYFHAWAFLGLGSISIFLKSIDITFSKINNTGVRVAIFFVQILAAFVFAVMLAYPYISIKQYIAPKFVHGQVDRFYNPNMSNGYAYMARIKDDDYNLISQMLILPYGHMAEAVTYDSYSYYARVSAYSGQSTITGWPLHNVQWYGGYEGVGMSVEDLKIVPTDVAQRVKDVESLYLSEDINEVRRVINKYDIDYIVVGFAEYKMADVKDKEIQLNNISTLCELDWHENNSYIFRCKND